MSQEGKWYIIQTASQYEKKVATAISVLQADAAWAEIILEVVVPVEEVVEMKAGKKAVSERKLYPGYVLVKLLMSDEVLQKIKSIPKVSGFLGGSPSKPTPLTTKEAERMLQITATVGEKPKPKVIYELGSEIRIKSGAFQDFQGNVDSVNYDKSKIKVIVTIFGRATPVEIDFGDVEKV